MTEIIIKTIPVLTVISHAAILMLVVALISRRSFGRGMVMWAGSNAIVIALVFSSAALLGSLFYSEIVGYTPCVLCWWQRIAIYPLVALFAVALKKKDRGVFSYALPLSVIGFVISSYHYYVQRGGDPLIPCDATNTCSQLHVFAYGYITIPVMAGTVALMMVLLFLANRFYEKENSHAR